MACKITFKLFGKMTIPEAKGELRNAKKDQLIQR
jgi:hypothetical protein